jgi:hypothetical protein
MHSRRVARQHDTERLRVRIEAERLAVHLPEAMVEDRVIEPAREPAQNVWKVFHDRDDALHVAPDHDVRHSRGR